MQSQLPEYAQRDSPFRRMDARWKLAAVLLAIGLSATLTTVAAAAVAFLGALLLLVLARLPLRWFLLRLSGVALFLSLFLVLLPLTMPGETWALGPLRISQPGVRLAGLIVLKALTAVALVLFLLATAPFETTLKAAHALHVPSLLVQLLMLTYRYIHLLGDELHKLRIALRLRGYRNRVSAHCYRTIGHVTGTLLVRSYERAERVGHAMRCRGFTGSFRALTSFRTRAADVALFGMMVLASVLIWSWERF
jgi:cobalt/nickel transport system permease protein